MRQILSQGSTLLAEGMWVISLGDATRRRVVTAHRRLVEPEVRTRMRTIDLPRLCARVPGAPLDALTQAEFRSAWDVLDQPGRFAQVPNMAPAAIADLTTEAERLAEAIALGVSAQIRPDRDDPETTELVLALHRLSALSPAIAALEPLTERVIPALTTNLNDAKPLTLWWRWALSQDVRARADTAFGRVEETTRWAADRDLDSRLRRLHAAAATPDDPDEAWLWFSADPPSAHALLAETIGQTFDTAAVEGYLPADLVASVRAFELQTMYSTTSLRSYQEFGARFLLHQGRAVLGDELGLGKSVQALAALAHLRGTGAWRFLVICPASQVRTWLRQVGKHTRLTAHDLTTTDDAARDTWLAEGGVGIIHYQGLGALDMPPALQLDALVADAAHFVKNPDAKRSRLVAELSDRADNVWFLTGVPMATRADEFEGLLASLRPDVALDRSALHGTDPARFRAAMAPIYLRRTAADVLMELPPLVRTDQWCDWAGADGRVYQAAVSAGNLSAMRRAAFCSPDPRSSAKLERLLELVTEARRSGHNVVIYSFFLSVLNNVMEGLANSGVASTIAGPLIASTTTLQRTAMVDMLAVEEEGSTTVLVAQIDVDLSELDLTGASVVILCEPQLDPQTERRAVARSHRIGQLDTVHAYRLITNDAVDERIIDLLDEDDKGFPLYRTADAPALEAAALHEASVSRQVINSERARLNLPGR